MNDKIRFDFGAGESQSKFSDSASIGKFSFVNRCRVGNYFGLGCFSYVADTVIGSYCTFGSRISVGAFSHPTSWLSIHEFQYRDTSKIYGETLCERLTDTPSRLTTSVGSDVWIGDNVVVLSGVSVGDGVVIGAGSVVTKDVPDFAIVVGNPARVVRYRFSPEIISKLKALSWWSLPMCRLEGIVFSDVESAIRNLEARNAGEQD
jgi:acetyltransferase-like isoleucine patch superfamily enzyme